MILPFHASATRFAIFFSLNSTHPSVYFTLRAPPLFPLLFVILASSACRYILFTCVVPVVGLLAATCIAACSSICRSFWGVMNAGGGERWRTYDGMIVGAWMCFFSAGAEGGGEDIGVMLKV